MQRKGKTLDLSRSRGWLPSSVMPGLIGHPVSLLGFSFVEKKGPKPLAGFRPRTTRSFCFGKRTQDHWRPGKTLRVPLPRSRLRGLRNSSLRQSSPQIEREGRSHARKDCKELKTLDPRVRKDDRQRGETLRRPAVSGLTDTDSGFFHDNQSALRDVHIMLQQPVAHSHDVVGFQVPGPQKHDAPIRLVFMNG